MDKAQLDTMLTEVGPLVNAIGLSHSDETPIWELEFEGEPPCYLQAGEREDHFVISGEVAPIPRQDRDALFRTMLLYNDQSAETGGARLAIDAEDGDVTLSIDLHASELSAEKLSNLIISYVELRSHWRVVVDGWSGVSDQTEGADLPTGPMIRV